MSIQVKSSLYFATLLIAMITYYNVGQAEQTDNTQMVNNTSAQVSTPEALN